MRRHDASYKKFFSFPEMVADLIRGFVHGAWVKKLDFTTLERVNGSYVSESWRQRHDDVVWRVRWGEEWLYIYILIEFQSEVDPFMALRMMTYLGLLYQDLIAQKRLAADRWLPPVLPIVLYNGIPRWRAPTDIHDLIYPLKGGFERYRPHVSYLLIDEGRFKSDDLAELKNLVAALFRLEKSRDPETVREVIANLIAWLRRPEQKPLQRAFTRWIYHVFIKTRYPKAEMPEIENLEEAHTMLSKTVVEWTKQWRQEGLEEGLGKGREEGRERMAKAILRQIERKFGPLNEADRRRILEASEEQLDTWADRILDATTLKQILKH
ncbi:MAG: putative transposase [Candidatus Ozemobacter sibiricus]|uniref:Putative transposase n=1 Tax=Candidatus Ozemobacter sibiricus TaxID=2268124 RepID=A0A367ZKR7_9BACT|nr:MAG: putative transposase [Candidatus Ozemobacter sibiricus]